MVNHELQSAAHHHESAQDALVPSFGLDTLTHNTTSLHDPPYQVLGRSASGNDEGDNPNGLAAALDANESVAENGSMFYSGNKHGAVGFLSDLVAPVGLPEESHYLVPQRTKRSKRPEDLSFLRAKGAFSIPPKQVCDELICAFFRHVYPFLPIIDAGSFLESYSTHGCQNINLLLLWSMFLAAANFVDQSVLQIAGYKSRKAMKRAIHQRAKCLYDSADDDDQLSLLQSTILMGFWYVNAEDRFEAWHWIGIAISLSQTLGLHRAPESMNARRHLPERRKSLLQRIWWSCFVRDRWLALVKGRPMRINLEDCDVQSPQSGDITSELDTLPDSTKARYIPYDPEAVERLWCKLVKLTHALGNVLKTHYRLNGPRAGLEDIETSRKEIEACAPSEEEGDRPHPNMRLLICQLKLFYEAAVVVLYRPYVLKGPDNLSAETQAFWQQTAFDRAKTAAANTNTVLAEIIDQDMVKYMKPMSITTLIPAMQIHLLDCKSPTPLTRRIGDLKLQFCMVILSELRETYWGADFTLKMFERAQAKLRDHSQGQVGLDVIDQTNRTGQIPIPLTPDSSVCTQQQTGAMKPTVEDILDPYFALVDNSYDFGMPGPGFELVFSPQDNLTLADVESFDVMFGDNCTSGQDVDMGFSLNSFLDPSEFDGFLGTV